MSPCVAPPLTAVRLFRSCLCALLILFAAAFCAEAFDYSCSNCASPNCVCASVLPPGGLNATNVPQIVLITFDDEVSTAAYAVCQQLLTNHLNPNGTPIQATFYIKTDNNDYRLTQQLYAQGHEIGVHTMTHGTGTNTDIGTWRREIYGARKALSELSQIPLSEIVGFRAPGLDYNHASFQALAEAGMEYDASVSEALGGLSKNSATMVWPYTLDNGLGQVPTKPPPQTNFPGFFEVPLWSILTSSGTVASVMDFPSGTSNEILNLFKLNIENRYMGGNRAPLGLFMHTYFLGEAGQGWRIDLLNDFIRWAQSNPDFESNIWFVSTHAAVEFMRNPVSKAAATSFPPFVTTQRTIPDESLMVTCRYTTAVFRTCNECPPVYPDPNHVFGMAVTTTGGAVWTEVTDPYSDYYGARLYVSNNTDKIMVDWEAQFRAYKGQLTTLYPGSYTTAVVGSGTRVTVRPYPTLRPLFPGEVETNYFWIENTEGNQFITDHKVTLYELVPTEPTLSPTVAFVDTNQVMTSWDNVAANYRLMFTTNQDFSNWQEVEVHGRTSMVTVLPPETVSGYFKLKTSF